MADSSLDVSFSLHALKAQAIENATATSNVDKLAHVVDIAWGKEDEIIAYVRAIILFVLAHAMVEQMDTVWTPEGYMNKMTAMKQQ